MEAAAGHPQRNRAQATIIALIALLSWLSLMSESKTKNAVWNDAENNALVDYLIEHKAEAGDGPNFKDVTYNGAAEAIAPLLTSGPSKTGKMCKNRWTTVSNHSFLIVATKKNYFKLKGTHTTIQYYQKSSGNTWDPLLGANITTETEKKNWDTHVAIKASSLLYYRYK
jgi:hypothetical protein